MIQLLKWNEKFEQSFMQVLCEQEQRLYLYCCVLISLVLVQGLIQGEDDLLLMRVCAILGCLEELCYYFLYND